MAQRQFRDDDTSSWADRFGNGSDGDQTISSSITDTTPNTTCSGTSGTTSVTVGSSSGFSNGNLIFIHQTQDTSGGGSYGKWELNKISSINSGTNWTLAYTLTNTYGSGAQVYLLHQYKNFTINSGQTLTSLSYNGSTGGILAILANTSITIAGGIISNGANGNVKGQGQGQTSVTNQGGYRGGYGTTSGSPQCGEGTGKVATTVTANTGGSGGGGTYDTAGGGGGNGAAGSNGSGGTTIGGTSSGNVGLTIMLPGGAGGGGGAGNGAGGGGNGGGIIFLISPTITVSGSIQSNGGVGGSQDRAGGGGAGGSILLKGKDITLGSNLLIAVAGGGGAGAEGNGGAGGVGRIHVDYLKSLSGTTNPSADTAIQKVFADLRGSANLYIL